MLTCSATTDAEEMDNMRVHWTRDGERVETDQAEGVILEESSDGHTLTITSELTGLEQH